MSLFSKLSLCLSVLFSTLSHAQNDSIAQAYLNQARAEFSKPFAEQDFVNALGLTAKAIELDPNNAEAYYILGNVYDKINAKDATSLLGISPQITELSAEALHKCLQLNPDFDKPIVLNPREKILSVYASLALKYKIQGDLDSLSYCFEKADELIADDFIIREFLQQFLMSCKPNAIVVSSGDMISYNLLYLQDHMGIRPDLTIFDINLLNTKWYPEYFRSKGIINFEVDSLELDSIKHLAWPANPMKIEDFIWDVHPSYSKYLLRGDMVFREVLRANKWEKDLYFTAGLSEKSALSLLKEAEPIMFGHYFHPERSSGLSSKKLLKKYSKIIKNHEHLSSEDLKALSMLRFYVLLEVNSLIEDDAFKAAKKLLKNLDKRISIDEYPYLHQSTALFRNQLNLSIKNEGLTN